MERQYSSPFPLPGFGIELGHFQGCKFHLLGQLPRAMSSDGFGGLESRESHALSESHSPTVDEFGNLVLLVT